MRVWDKETFMRGRKTMESFMPLNTHYEKIWREALHLHDIPTPHTLETNVMGPELGRWCKIHRVKGHHTKLVPT